MLAPLREIPVGYVVVRVPPHTLVVADGTVRFAGSLSVKATPASATVFTAGLVMVKVSALVAPKVIAVGLKAFAMTGGATTIKFAVAVLPVPPFVELTLPVVFV